MSCGAKASWLCSKASEGSHLLTNKSDCTRTRRAMRGKTCLEDALRRDERKRRGKKREGDGNKWEIFQPVFVALEMCMVSIGAETSTQIYFVDWKKQGYQVLIQKDSCQPAICNQKCACILSRLIHCTIVPRHKVPTA